MEPNEAPLPPFGTLCSLSYVADPDGTKIEMIEWHDLEAGWPADDGPQGVNHVAFGVADIERTRDFYRSAGLHRDAVRERWLLRADGSRGTRRGAAAPAHDAAHQSARRRHGAGPAHTAIARHARRVGPPGSFEFAIGVRNIEHRRRGPHGRRNRVAVRAADGRLEGGGSWSYAYFREPDDTFVAITEIRY